jgi:integrase
MRSQGYKESTVCGSVATLKGLAKRVDLVNCESVKQYLANAPLSEGRKEKITDDLARFYKHENIHFDKPTYKRVSTLPFIPHEKEIDQLIAKLGKKTATYLQLLKETGIRAGEAWNLKWIDIDSEKSTVNIAPEKNSNPRQLKISSNLMSMLNQMPRKSEHVFHVEDVDPIKSLDNHRTAFEKQRRKAALSLQNPRLSKITFKALRHWRATSEYHRTKDILHVMHFLGHKNIKNTIIYTHLVNWETDDYTCKVASTVQEASNLIESGFEYVTDFDGQKLFRKRK